MPESLGKIGPYELLRRLGAGGMGEVFLAYDERLDRQVAIKMAISFQAGDPSQYARSMKKV